MIPRLRVRRAGSVDEAVALLAEHGDEAKLLAGGHSLLPMMKLRFACPRAHRHRPADRAGLHRASTATMVDRRVDPAPRRDRPVLAGPRPR